MKLRGASEAVTFGECLPISQRSLLQVTKVSSILISGSYNGKLTRPPIGDSELRVGLLVHL